MINIDDLNRNQERNLRKFFRKYNEAFINDFISVKDEEKEDVSSFM